MKLSSRPACTTCEDGPPAGFHAYLDVYGGQVDMVLPATCLLFEFCHSVTFEIHTFKTALA